jgi:putative transposase
MVLAKPAAVVQWHRARHLRSILSSYFTYYRHSRTHLSLDKDCPETRPIQPVTAGKIIAFPEVGGLHHRYERLAA